MEDNTAVMDTPRSKGRAGAGAMSRAEQVESLYERYQPLVFRLALRYGRGDTSWAEDITQDIFLNLLKVMDRLTDLENLSSWFYRVTTNHCLNRLRRDLMLQTPLRWLLGQRSAAPRTPEAMAMARTELQLVMGELAKLPPKERVVFYMYHVDGKNQPEIGRTLGYSKGYVCKLLKRATERIRSAGWRLENE